MIKLKINKQEALPPFVGCKHLQILGQGSVQLLKSIDGGRSHYPATDDTGEVVTFTSDTNGVLFNGEIHNDNGTARYAVQLLEGSAEMGVL